MGQSRSIVLGSKATRVDQVTLVRTAGSGNVGVYYGAMCFVLTESGPSERAWLMGSFQE